MSFHNNYNDWKKMTARENCPVCNRQPLPGGMVDVAELPSSWLNAESAECLQGACRLVAKQHAIEVYELTDDELLGLMKDLKKCARALKNVTGAVKINYEIHGNTLPHLHIHLYPRYIDDPFPGRPIDFNQKRADLYQEGEFASFVEEMRRELAGGG